MRSVTRRQDINPSAPRGRTRAIRRRDRRDGLSGIGAIAVPRSCEHHRLPAVLGIHRTSIRTPEATEFPRIEDRGTAAARSLWCWSGSTCAGSP
jgi:hypothetical protein